MPSRLRDAKETPYGGRNSDWRMSLISHPTTIGVVFVDSIAIASFDRADRTEVAISVRSWFALVVVRMRDLLVVRVVLRLLDGGFGYGRHGD